MNFSTISGSIPGLTSGIQPARENRFVNILGSSTVVKVSATVKTRAKRVNESIVCIFGFSVAVLIAIDSFLNISVLTDYDLRLDQYSSIF
jgi:hypothetical protein